jgi:hypothetical protein
MEINYCLEDWVSYFRTQQCVPDNEEILHKLVKATMTRVPKLIPLNRFFIFNTSKLWILCNVSESYDRPSGGLLRNRQWSFGFRKRRRISWPAKWLSASLPGRTVLRGVSSNHFIATRSVVLRWLSCFRSALSNFWRLPTYRSSSF